MSPYLHLTFALVVLGGLAGCATTKTPAGDAKRRDTDFAKRGEVVYTPGGWPRALRADVYQPRGAGPWPAVLLIYGGSWSDKDHRWQMRLLARKLAGRGYVVMIPAYRGTPEYRYPASLEDMREALRWLRGHAADYQVNPGKVAAYGFSAGGQLAALLGTLEGPPQVRVQAVVAASAPVDLTLKPTGEILPRYLGVGYEENPALYREASPVTHVSPDDPPVFIYQGTDDKMVWTEHSRMFKAALDRAGVRNELYWLKGRGHAGALIFGGAAEDKAIDFLDSVLR